jgi:uncharacterized protein YprB with RNaseH-like and TPR domain
MDLQTRLMQLRAKAQARGLAPSPASVPGLGERLERLRVGAPARGVSAAEALGTSVEGTVVAPGLIEVRRTYALPFEHGDVSIASGSSLADAAKSVGRLSGAVSPEQLLFLDTETTGLSGGTGTTAFVVGVGWLEGCTLRLVQWLMAGFAAESGLVARVANRIARAGVIVSFNGKSFDLPLLKTRARLVGQELRADGLDHVDLLHVTRRLLRSGWPDCRLATAEECALGLERTNDLPGAEAPAAWRRWLERGDANPLGRVVDHNRADLLSLVALLALLEHPTAREAPLLHARA